VKFIVAVEDDIGFGNKLRCNVRPESLEIRGRSENTTSISSVVVSVKYSITPIGSDV
jgi:hypothetical protein